MKIGWIYFVLILGFIWGCSQKKDKTSFLILELLKRETFSEKLSFVFFISDRMCSECVNKEFMNMREDSLIMHNITLIGLFKQKRYFIATSNAIAPLKKIHVHLTDKNELNIHQPLYLLYNKETQSILNIFTPDPCDVRRTKKYFDMIRKSILLQSIK